MPYESGFVGFDMFELPKKLPEKNAPKMGLRSGRLPDVIPIPSSTYVHMPGLTCETDYHKLS